MLRPQHPEPGARRQQYLLLPLHDRGCASVYVDGDPGQVAGPLRREERDHVAGFRALTHTSQRDPVAHVFVEPVQGQIGLVCLHGPEPGLVLAALDKADAHGVDQNVVGGELL